MKILLTSLLLISSLYSTDDAFSELDAYNNSAAKMEAEFESMKLNQKNEFEQYSESLKKEYSDYTNELSKYWEEPKLSTKKTWVSYSNDKKSRSKVDFEKNEVVIEVIASSPQKAKEKIEKRLAYVVTKNTKEVVETDPLQKKIAEISKKSLEIKSVVDEKPILEKVIFKKKPTKKEVKKYTQKVVKKEKIVVKKSNKTAKNVYKITIPLPKNTKLKRSAVYKDNIAKYAQHYKVPIELVFAIMETESNFNPFAKSHIPAFGLMQIVPTSAGRDVYYHLYKKKGMPTASYLYNSKNNIEMGSTYLYILYYRYLRKIKNPTSRLYCTIAAYNTGAGNIAWAFTRKYNINRAVGKINALTPEEVYDHLQANLRFDEPKHYLKRVRKRMPKYVKAYRL